VALEVGLALLTLSHLRQRRRRVAQLCSAFAVRFRTSRNTRVAWADGSLAFIAVNVAASGLADLIARRPVFLPALGPVPPMRWHAASGLFLAVMCAAHVARRARRLRTSRIR